jgi:integrase
MIRVIGEIEKRDMSQWTKHDYKVTIKRFYRWFNDGIDPDYTNWIHLKIPNNHIPDELLTEDDIKKMILTASNNRDRALIAILYDSGCRISEIGNLKIKHIVFDQYGGAIHVDGKTGRRRVRIISSCPYLASWLEIHPYRENPESDVWINIGVCNHNKHMTYNTFAAVIKRLAKKAGIQKRLHPHLFRHTRSTELAQHLTQAQMEAHLGWIHGSKMPATYIHLSGAQVDNALLKMYGLKPEEEKATLSFQECKRCKHRNGATSTFCSVCGASLTIENAINIEEQRNDIAKKFMAMIKNDPSIIDLMNQFES